MLKNEPEHEKEGNFRAPDINTGSRCRQDHDVGQGNEIVLWFHFQPRVHHHKTWLSIPRTTVTNFQGKGVQIFAVPLSLIRRCPSVN